MTHAMEILDDGAICAFTVGGRVDPDQLLASMRVSMEYPALHASLAYFVDVSEAQLSHLTFSDVRQFSKNRNELRAMLSDRRPVAIYAPSPVLYGLIRVMAAFDPAPLEVFRDREQALEWIRRKIAAAGVGVGD